jgi:hypothetical protein
VSVLAIVVGPIEREQGLTRLDMISGSLERIHSSIPILPPNPS